MAMPDLAKLEPVSHVITMIHGTFATHARWTLDNSPLCQALRDHLSRNLIIRRFSWSGANRNLDRLDASKQLAGMLHEDIRRYPDAAHFIIAHSHGGNVALYALNDISLQSKLHGIICMNTPFIGATRRNVEQVFFGLALLFLFICIGWVGTFFAVMISDLFASSRDYSLVWFSPFFLAWVIVVLVYARKFWSRAKDWFIRKCEETIISLALPRTAAPRVLCIWSGDEVFSVFNTLEGLSNIPYLVLNVYFVVLLFATAVGLSFIAPEKLFPFSNDFGSHLEGLVMGHLFGPSMWAMTFLLLIMTAAIFVNFLFRIVPMGLPWRLLITSFFVRLSFTQIPFGAQQLSSMT
jgi:hypothetical protein